MRHQILLIKIAYIFTLLLAVVYYFPTFQRGFFDGLNEASAKQPNLMSSAFLVLILVIGINIITKLYAFINAIQEGEVFSLINVNKISRLGWYAILQSLLLYGFYFAKSDFKQGPTYHEMVSINFDFWLLIAGIIVLTIGFVLKKGIELQHEQDLTI